MNKIFLLTISTILLLVSCDIPEPERRNQRIKKTPVKVELNEEMPWSPPVIDIKASKNSFKDLPRYLHPRASKFSGKMWKNIESNINDFISYRRFLHSNPELAHREVNTGRYLVDQMKSLGIKQVGPVGLTGVAFLLQGKKYGPTIAVLAGIDGLPVTETTGLRFASKAYGYWDGRKVRVSHAAGKDIEMSVLLGTAKIISDMKNRFAGRVLFVFQPASTKVQTNERPGAEEIINSGILERFSVSAMFHLPLDPGIPTGKVGIPTGAVEGGLTRFSIVVEGTKNRICSGTVPWKCIDPIAVSAHMVQELLMLPGRKFGPNHRVILNVGTINGGEAAHLMAPKVIVSGTFRWMINSDRKKMEYLIKNLIRGSMKISGTKIRVAFTKGPQMKVGNSELTSWSLGTLVRSLGKRGILPADPLANPGDYPLYHKQLPIAMFLLGCSKKGHYAGRRGDGNFNPDEESISVGVHVLSNLVMDFFTSRDTPKIHFKKSK